MIRTPGAAVAPCPYRVRVTRDMAGPRPFDAAPADARRAVAEFDDACNWLTEAGDCLPGPLAAEVWVFDESPERVLLVEHRWRGWVPPGGKAEPGETPRQGAARELFEETGVRAVLLDEPAAVAVRSFRADWTATLSLSYAAVVDAGSPLGPESGRPAGWAALDRPWESCLPEDRPRMRRHADRIARRTVHGRRTRLPAVSPRRRRSGRPVGAPPEVAQERCRVVVPGLRIQCGRKGEATQRLGQLSCHKRKLAGEFRGCTAQLPVVSTIRKRAAPDIILSNASPASSSGASSVQERTPLCAAKRRVCSVSTAMPDAWP